MSERLDVGFVPAECPGAPGSGAVETSTLLIEHLSERHDLTVYVSSQMDAAEATLPAEDRVEYVLHDNLSKLPHPIVAKHEALRGELPAMERHDLVHSYSAAFIPLLAELDVPTLSTLNSYVPVCPKGDMMYHGEEKCSGPSPAKCVACIAATSAKRRQGVERELRASYSSLGKIDLVQKSIDRAGEIDAYHALSPHLADDYDALGFPRDRTTVIPHFYDEAFHREEPDPDAGIDDDEPVTLLYVGALQDIKGLHVLIPGLAEMRERGHDVELEIVGAGPYESRLKELAEERGVADAIDWLGYVDHGDLPGVYDEADAFVYPGLIDEPFGRVVLEALSMRTPLLVSDVGSMDYIVGDAGEPFAPGEPSALADAFERLVADYDARYAAIDDELDRFTPETIIGTYSDLYREVAAEKHVVAH